MMMTREQGNAIAVLMASLRPEWDYPGCFAAVAKVQTMDPANVALAAIRLATTEEVRTPGALSNLNGPHWREKVSASQVRYPPRKDEACPRHPGEWPDSCRSCAADKLAGDASAFNPRRTAANEQALALARAELAQAKANLCSHGIRPSVCLEKHDRPSSRDERDVPKERV
jgi:hypothetical protein